MIAKKDMENRWLYLSFDGVDELMKTAMRYKEDEFKDAHDNWRHCFDEKDRWNGNHTLSMVAEELLEPAPKMASVLESGSSLFDSDDWATEKPRRKVLRRLDEGDEIDVDRWLQREPDMWEESRKVQGSRFGVRIGVNIATSAHVGEEGFKWRTSAVVAILSICEELQIPCEVMCYEQTTDYVSIDGDSLGLFFEFPVKRSEHLLDIDLLGYVLGSRSFFRTAVLGGGIIGAKSAFKERCRVHYGLGYPHEVSRIQENEFILSRACLDESSARSELERFKDWLVQIRRRSQFNMDGLEDLHD